MTGGLSLKECQDRYESARAGKQALLELGGQAIPQVRTWLKRWYLGLAQADVEVIAERSFDIVGEKILGIPQWLQFLSYLAKTAYSIASKCEHRRRARSSPAEALDAEDPASSASRDEVEARDALAALQERLSPRLRRQFELHVRHELLGERMEDLAREEGVSLRTFKAREKELREYLRGCAQRVGYEATPPGACGRKKKANSAETDEQEDGNA
jgi:hypothetical protein